MKAISEVAGKQRGQLPRLRLVEAPAGWSALVLEAEYPVPPEGRRAYLVAVAELIRRLPMLRDASAEEVLLQFDRCRPDHEILVLQQNARAWLPEIGLGVWLDRPLPALWTEDEFLAAAPGELRPLLYRVFRIQPAAAAQRSAWQLLLGSGVLLRIAQPAPGLYVEEATEFLQPRMTEPSLTSFPFYLPLLTARGLLHPDPALGDIFASVASRMDAYVRESAEDGGLIVIVRQPPESLKAALLAQPATREELKNSSAPQQLPWALDVG